MAFTLWKRTLSGFLLVLLLGNMLAFGADTFKLRARKTWTVDVARKEAFKDLNPQISTADIAPIDPELLANREAIRHKQLIQEDKEITVFDNGQYSVKNRDTGTRYYYTPQGELIQLDIYKNETIYPIKGATYSFKDGRLSRVILTVSPGESYVFKPKGQLQFYWKGNRCYTANNRSCGTRQQINPDTRSQ